MGGEGGYHADSAIRYKSFGVVEMGAEDVRMLRSVLRGFHARWWPLKRARESSLLSSAQSVVWRVCAD
jgi:hypothetical protein